MDENSLFSFSITKSVGDNTFDDPWLSLEELSLEVSVTGPAGASGPGPFESLPSSSSSSSRFLFNLPVPGSTLGTPKYLGLCEDSSSCCCRCNRNGFAFSFSSAIISFSRFCSFNSSFVILSFSLINPVFRFISLNTFSRKSLELFASFSCLEYLPCSFPKASFLCSGLLLYLAFSTKSQSSSKWFSFSSEYKFFSDSDSDSDLSESSSDPTESSSDSSESSSDPSESYSDPPEEFKQTIL